MRRSSSSIAPRMRGTAKVLNDRPRDGSNASAACKSPTDPALTSSSSSASVLSRDASCRAT
jgi:hypothetical protein